MNDDISSSFNVQEFLKSGWKRIAYASVVGLAVGITYALLAPKWYAAEVTVIPSGSKGGGGLPGAAAALGVTELPIDIGGSSDLDRVAAIFHSYSVADVVIARHGLMARYDAIYIEDARAHLWRHCGTKLDKKAGLVTLTCEDRVPAKAQAMVRDFVETANQVARRVSASSAGEERRFLETRVSQSRADLDKASVKLRDFQEKNKVVSLPDQARAIVTSMATLRAEMLDKQMQLAYVDGFSSSDESTSGGLRRQVSILQNKIKSLEETRSSANPAAVASGQQSTSEQHHPSSLFPPAMDIPILQYQLEQLTRDTKVEETLFGLLTQRYELARVNEARDTSSFMVLDGPTLPTKKSRPLRTILSIEGLLLGCFIGVGLAVVAWKKRRGPVVSPEASPAPSR